MKYLLLSFVTIIIYSGCSAKKINSNVESITNDISKVFKDSQDTSSK